MITATLSRLRESQPRLLVLSYFLSRLHQRVSILVARLSFLFRAHTGRCQSDTPVSLTLSWQKTPTYLVAQLRLSST